MASEYARYPPSRPRVALPLILAGAALVLTGWMAFDRFWPAGLFTDVSPRTVTPRGELAEIEQATIDVFEQNAPSVVHITSPGIILRDRWSRPFAVPEGVGSGFVWDERGYVVTNYHVVERRRNVEVRLLGAREYSATVVGAEPSLDIAVVKLTNPPPGLRPIPIGSSRDLRVGQSVFAIGNPYGLDHSLSTGIVSALDRVIESVVGTPIEGVIQVDAAINPGNSGGPLLDSAGRLIGMNTAIKSPTGASAGIGFAVPVDTINRYVPRIISGDAGQRPALGITVRSMPMSDGTRRPMIVTVQSSGGAADAGLRGMTETGYGDVILSVDGVEIMESEDLHAILDQRKVGDRIDVRVLRDPGGREQIVTVPVELKTEIQRDER